MELKPIVNFKRTNVYKRNASKAGWQLFNAEAPMAEQYMHYSELTLSEILESRVYEVTAVALFGGCLSIRMGK